MFVILVFAGFYMIKGLVLFIIQSWMRMLQTIAQSFKTLWTWLLYFSVLILGSTLHVQHFCKMWTSLFPMRRCAALAFMHVTRCSLHCLLFVSNITNNLGNEIINYEMIKKKIISFYSGITPPIKEKKDVLST